MTDERDTKEMLDKQMAPLQEALERGTASPSDVQKALGIALAHLRIFVKRETVQQDEFDVAMQQIDERFKNHVINCPGAALMQRPFETAGTILARGMMMHFPWIIIVIGIIAAFKWMK